MNTFTASLAEIAPYDKDFTVTNLISYNKQPQYTSYNYDIIRTIGVVPSFFKQSTGSFTSSGLWYNDFIDENQNLIDANQFTDFNYIFDVYQLDESVPNLQDIYGYRYNQFEMYGINSYTAGRKIKNLGRYKVAPNPKTGLGSLNISRVLRAHMNPETQIYPNYLYPFTQSTGFETPFMVPKIKNLINSSGSLYSYTRNIYEVDTQNTCKWNIEYGFEVNPGLTFSDTVFSAGSYINPGTGLVATYSLGFTFSTPHYLKYGDEIIIQMNNLGLNPDYNGLCYVVDVVNPFHIVVDKGFGQSSTNEGGSITYLLRTNEIQSGNWWKYFGWKYGGADWSNKDSYGNLYLGFMNGRQTVNYSINSTVQRNLNPISNNIGQVGFLGTDITGNRNVLQDTVINDVSQLQTSKWLMKNYRLGTLAAETQNYNLLNTPRFFMTNWDDTTMGRKPLNFYKWGDFSYRNTNYPSYTLGVLTHQNFWPAYWRNFDVATYAVQPGENLATVPTFNYVRWTHLDSLGATKSSYEKFMRDLYATASFTPQNMPRDYEKYEIMASGDSVWKYYLDAFQDVEQGDIFRVELLKKAIPGWANADYSEDFVNATQDWNTIMDFDGVDYDDTNRTQFISAYPFHYQFKNYYDPSCDNYGTFIGPFGSVLDPLTSGQYDIKDWNFKHTSATVSVNDANWPYTVLAPAAGNSRGYWKSQMSFNVNDSSCGPVVIDVLQINELFNDIYLADNGYGPFGSQYFPAGTYSIDYKVISATSSDVLNFIWRIGGEQVYLPTVVGGVYLTQELYTNGGSMQFIAEIETEGTLLIEPYKIRHHSDMVVAKKEFTCNIVCRGQNPYSIPFGKWDYGSPIELLFLNRLGSYERLYFEYDSKRNINVSRTNYNRSMIRDRWGLFDERHTNTILSQKATEQYVINSNWIEQNKLFFYEELLTSPEVYIVQKPAQQGSGFSNAESVNPYETYVPVLVQDTQFTNKTIMRDKLFNLQMTIQVAFDINLQNE
jgi:hypothetical protein